jgi:hypothetical protein
MLGWKYGSGVVYVMRYMPEERNGKENEVAT